MKSMDKNKEKQLEAYLKSINTPPAKSEIEVYEGADNAEYIPIGVLQNKLDEFFKGYWNWHCESQLQANSVVVTGTISYINPVTSENLSKSGIGAMEYRGGNVNTAAPVAESFAFKNACKKIGVAFGRDLNRDHVVEFKGKRFKTNK